MIDSDYLDKKDLVAKFEEETIITKWNKEDKSSPIVSKYYHMKDEIKEYENKISGWVSVKDRLPKGFYPCLVVDVDGDYGVGYYREDTNCWDSPNFGWLEMKDRVDNHDAFSMPCRLGKIVAWMPVPEYNKEDNNG